MTAGVRRLSSRRCRVSRRLIFDTINRAVNSWCRIFSHELAEFSSAAESCAILAKDVKKFLSQELNGVPEEAVMAFRSIKKLLPPSCPCMEPELIEKLIGSMTRDPIILPHGYLAFAGKLAGELFPVGWDTTYRNHCYTTAPPISACAESPRGKGGVLQDSPEGHPEFLDAVLMGKLGSDRAAALIGVVQSAGKPRPLASFSSDTLVLKPLHKAIYDNISKRRWLLRGSLSDAALSRAGFRKADGRVLVSGDYCSATDNLPIQVAEVILRKALANASRVPQRIGEYALRNLRPDVWLERESFNAGLDPEFRMTASQQMGSLLSFPLLCIQNYIAFRYACFRARVKSRGIPILINGDDILFQAEPEFAKTWMEVVGQVGLEVERSKTSITSEYGSLNSTLVRPSGDGFRVVPTLRFGMLRPCEYPHSLFSSFRDFISGAPRKGQSRWIASREWFSWHRQEFKQNLSLHELGFSGRLAFRAASREAILQYQKLRIEVGDPLQERLPPPPNLHNVVLSGDNICKVKSLTDEESLTFGREVVSWKWKFRGSFEKKDLKIRYTLMLHSIRFKSNQDSLKYEISNSLRRLDYWHLPRQDGPEKWEEKYWQFYNRERPVEEQTLLYFDYLDRLPTYEENEGTELDRTPWDEVPSKECWKR